MPWQHRNYLFGDGALSADVREWASHREDGEFRMMVALRIDL
jgi:hypothetical protein